MSFGVLFKIVVSSESRVLILLVIYVVNFLSESGLIWMEKVVVNIPEKQSPCENGFPESSCPSTENGSLVCNGSLQKELDVKDALSYANILRTRNKFAEALTIYEGILEKDKENVEAFIGKGICLQMQNMGRLAFESFSEAITLDPQNACALTHCGILYKDDGRLVDAAEV